MIQSQRSALDLTIDLLRVIAQLLWPLTILLLLILFRGDIHRLAVRLRRGKFLGQEIELEKETQKVDEKVEAAERAEQEKPVINPWDKPAQLLEMKLENERVQAFLEQAAQDKMLALLRIWIELEQELRKIVATTGLRQFVTRPAVSEYVRILAERNLISSETADSLLTFYNLRNRLVHGHLREAYRDGELISLIDSGLRLLEILRLIPRETYTVHRLVPFFSDPSATKQVTDALAVILDVSAGDGKRQHRIFPTTRSYSEGQTLSWEWNLGKIWGPAWYRDPDTAEVKHAWSSSAEFVGRPLEAFE